MNEDNRDFSSFTIEQLLDFLHCNKVTTAVHRQGERIGEPYEIALHFNGTGLNNNEVRVMLSASGQSLQLVLHGLVKDFLRLK